MLASRRIHVIKLPTNRRDLFPYSHYSDVGHNPLINTSKIDNKVILTCKDFFKLKPNRQVEMRTRADIYIPGYSALELGNDILALVGPGSIAELATVNPEDFRRGPQTLPLIDEARKVRHDGTEMHIAGSVIYGKAGAVYLDRERPAEGHTEMVGSEVHLGIPLSNVEGPLNENQIGMYQVPQHELRSGEVNPMRKALGFIRLSFEINQAQNLAATLIYYGQRH